MLLFHAQRSEVFLPLLFARLLMDAQRRFVVVEIILTLDRFFVSAIFGLQGRPRAYDNHQPQYGKDDPLFNCHNPTPHILEPMQP